MDEVSTAAAELLQAFRLGIHTTAASTGTMQIHARLGTYKGVRAVVYVYEPPSRSAPTRDACVGLVRAMEARHVELLAASEELRGLVGEDPFVATILVSYASFDVYVATLADGRLELPD